jgi:TonB family protein
MKKLLMLMACTSALFSQTSTRSAQDVVPPYLTHKVEADYTTAARKNGVEGVAILSARIGTDGIPRDISVVQSLDPGLDQKALEALKQWRFRPAKAGAQLVSSEAKIQFQFRLPKSPVLTNSGIKPEEEPVEDNDPVFPFWW